ADTDTALGLSHLALIDEVAGPVLFAGEVSPPRGITVTTVVQGAAGLAAIRREGGYDFVCVGYRAAEIHGGSTGEAAIVFVVLDYFPAAVVKLDAYHSHA